jgi:chlorite dismutase
MSHTHSAELDIRERGADRDGAPQLMDRRLFMQLLVLELPSARDSVGATARLQVAFAGQPTACVLYADVNDPRSVGLLSFSDNPHHLVDNIRPAFAAADLDFRVRHDMTMLGRTYSSGFEDDLEYWLLRRPRETVLNEAWPWAVWYPLRRSGAFERLEPREKSVIMREHATIGKTYGAADLAHDVRLACHGLDANDNEFVIGLVGQELYPLSHVVQSMRRTRQTAEFIVQMGPFFVGRALWRNPGA